MGGPGRARRGPAGQRPGLTMQGRVEQQFECNTLDRRVAVVDHPLNAKSVPETWRPVGLGFYLSHQRIPVRASLTGEAPA
jgi:hypothetical protein